MSGTIYHKTEQMQNSFVREAHSSREEWLKARKSIPGSTGASEIAVVMGMNHFQSVDELYDTAVGLREPKEIHSAAIDFGVSAEDPIRQLVRLYCEDEYEAIEHHPYDILRMAEKPWQFATLDGDIICKDGRRGVLEIKTGEVYSRKYLTAWENGVPDHYFVQGLRQLLVTGWDFVHFVAFIRVRHPEQGVPDITWYNRFVYREDVLEDLRQVEIAGDYFHNCVVNKTRPKTILRGFQA